ncbi:MAG: thiamine pyrophosphate-binding protein [Alphaproteobacteria bacterium]
MIDQKSEPTAVQAIARRLADAGCRYAFGIPGGEVIAMIDALEEAGIRFILTKHENGAGFMAEGVFHMTGAPAILVSTLGPGAANTVNVVANAEQDRVPMIVLTGCVDPEEALSYNHQVFDHRAMFAPITKGSFTLGDGAADVLADRAVSLAVADRPGPVHIDLPISRQGKPLGKATVQRHAIPSPVAPAQGPDLETARQWLAGSKTPIIIAGLDVLQHKASDDLAAFCRDFSIPLIASYKAKGILPEDDPLALGGAGLSPIADTHLLPLVRRADLIMLIGYDPIEMRTGWQHPWDPARQNVLEITSAPNDHFMHQATLSFICNVRAGIAALRDGVNPSPTWPGGEPASAKEALSGAFGQNEEWGPTAIVEAARAALPRNGIATVDSGAHRILLSQVWPCFAERQLIQSTGLCTMGCALPLAIGAKLAAPDLPVVAFTGDAGLEMILGELATLRDLGLAVPVVIFTDRSLALIELKQRQRGLKNVGVDFGGTDFAALGTAMGGYGIAVRDRAALTSALKDALNADRFTLISAEFDRKAYDNRL